MLLSVLPFVRTYVQNATAATPVDGFFSELKSIVKSLCKEQRLN